MDDPKRQLKRHPKEEPVSAQPGQGTESPGQFIEGEQAFAAIGRLYLQNEVLSRHIKVLTERLKESGVEEPPAGDLAE